jgi:hypothetical protein
MMERQMSALTLGWMLAALLSGAAFAAAPGQEDTQEAIDKKEDLFPILTEVFGR